MHRRPNADGVDRSGSGSMLWSVRAFRCGLAGRLAWLDADSSYTVGK
ncbi:hypothetical protein [Streptomyces canus]|nr:hypothetical protein [Streptomyces canus]